MQDYLLSANYMAASDFIIIIIITAFALITLTGRGWLEGVCVRVDGVVRCVRSGGVWGQGIIINTFVALLTLTGRGWSGGCVTSETTRLLYVRSIFSMKILIRKTGKAGRNWTEYIMGKSRRMIKWIEIIWNIEITYVLFVTFSFFFFFFV